MIQTTVFCRTMWVGFHCWPDAPKEVFFLRSLHRHVFHVEMRVPVAHDDRDVEFLLLKEALDTWLQGTLESKDTLAWSCEHWARAIMDATWLGGHKPCYVSVSEDGENGAVLQRVGVSGSGAGS